MSVCLSVLLIATALRLSEASCFGKDAHFDKNVAPVISQPKKTEPTLVTVNWEKQIQRPQCVDRYFVRVWPDGTEMTGGRRVLVDKKDSSGKEVLKSVEVEVEPCISYRFRVELEEDDSITGKDLEITAEQTFRTTATTSVLTYAKNLDLKNRPQATYWWDPVKKVVDLSKVSITFPNNFLKYPSCLDHIQVTGAEVKSRTGPSLSRQSSRTRGRALSFSHLELQDPAFNPSITAGNAQTLPAKISYSDVTQGKSASRQSSSSSSSSAGSPLSIVKPAFAYSLPRPSGGAATKLGPIKVSPPYLRGLPEVLVPVSGCNQFTFDIQFVAGGKTLDSLLGVVLPPLADIAGYVPAPITSVMTISYDTKGRAIYAVKKDSGVTAACLPAYFEAYDAYIQRLENEAGWQIGSAAKMKTLVEETKADLLDSEKELLKAVGCSCTSPTVELTSTDPKVLKATEKNQLGEYSFGGVYENYPYFMKKADLSGKENKVPLFLFYSKKTTQWLLSAEVGSTKNLFFGSYVNPTQRCPGDKGMLWNAATGSFGRWKNSPLTVVRCGRSL